MMANVIELYRSPVALPAEIKSLKAWVVWKLEQIPGEVKPRKIPYYIDGRPSAKDDVTAAARYEVHQQIHDFHNLIASNQCEMCGGDLAGGEHVDHVTPFDVLLSGWLSEQGLEYAKVAVEDLGLSGRFADRQLGESWQAWHAHHATLRITHSQCNLRRGRK